MTTEADADNACEAGNQGEGGNGQDPGEIMDQILERTRFFPVPPDGFDPLTASSDELRDFGLPLPPNEQTHPALYEFWRRMYGLPPLKFIPISFSFKGFEQLSAIIHRRQALGFRTRRQTSPNWSGAYIKPRDGEVFTEIWGQWQVPGPAVPPTAAMAGSYYRCSTWIGLDGQRRYYQSSLPQIGTAQSINDATGQLEFDAWWQWWVRDEFFP
ncbi:MAG: G1 family endopeptidase, partial [Alphaproteobacteria bacterium]|nr:G1 family endopeptidase [Alphaproteobacteria bacterium]